MAHNTFNNLPQDKQARVMAAAAAEFAEHGFHQASVNRMVKAIGIAKGSLFKYFGTKEGLFEALFEQALAQLKDSLRGAVAQEGDFYARIRSLMLTGLEFIDAHPTLFRIYLKLLVQENAPLRDRLITTVRASTTKFLRALVTDGIRKGDLRSDLNVTTAVFLLESLLERFFQGARVPGLDASLHALEGTEAEERVDQLLELIRTGLAPEQAA